MKRINKKFIIQLTENLMIGVNKGFHASPIPGWAVKNYSKLEDLKPELRNDNSAITQDLSLRLGGQALAKATVGGVTALGLDAIRDEISPDASDAYIAVPAIAAAWKASTHINDYIPKLHKKVFKNASIYK